MSNPKRNSTVEYTLRVPNGGVIPLCLVADAMARGVATNYGELKFHRPTYDNAIGGYEFDLLDAARSGRLVVCNERGVIGTADGIIEAAKKSNGGTTLDADGNIDWDQTHLTYLRTTAQCLNDWMWHKGDTFTVIDMPVEMIEHDLTDFNGKVIEKGYYRSFVAELSSQATLSKEASDAEPEDMQADAIPKQPVMDTSNTNGNTSSDIGISRNQVISAFTVRPDANENFKYWDDKLGRPPKWLKLALVHRGKPGKSSRWTPLMIAHCLLDKKEMTLIQLSTAMHKEFPELYERWKEETKDLR